MFNRRYDTPTTPDKPSALAKVKHDINVVLLTLGLISMGFNYAQVTGLPPFDAPVIQPSLTYDDPIFTPVSKPVQNTKHKNRG